MSTKTVAAQAFVRHELVAAMRKDTRAVRLEFFARAPGVEVRTWLLAGVVELAVGLGVGLRVLGLVVVGSFELRGPPARTKKRGSVAASLRE
jgi:hypothetical protein